MTSVDARRAEHPNKKYDPIINSTVGGGSVPKSVPPINKKKKTTWLRPVLYHEGDVTTLHHKLHQEQLLKIFYHPQQCITLRVIAHVKKNIALSKDLLHLLHCL
ncbi:hypothetical protein QQF64_004489 [Cirrhinus molitorella]|uniref:Uncharacterized protein n=1 Tax=Cirrhinus molitorella TaxID=172907 RepID=A0ABR3MJE5_9TELE